MWTRGVEPEGASDEEEPEVRYGQFGRRRHPKPRPLSGTFWAGLVAAGLITAVLVVRGLAIPYLPLLALVGLAIPFVARWLRRYGASSHAQTYAIAATYMVLLSTLVFRKRTSAALAENPLDTAGLYRLVALVLAALLAGLAIQLTSARRAPRVPTFALFYASYIVASALAITIAVNKGLVTFRVLELSVFFVVFLAVFRSFEGHFTIPIRHLMFFVWALMGSAVVSFIISPTESMKEIYGDNRLKGLYPYLSSDYLGILATLSVGYGLSQRRIRWGQIFFGLAIIAATRHRTGMLVVAALVVIRLVITRRGVLIALAAAIAAVGLLIAGSGVVSGLWDRGQASTQVATLSSRTQWWSDGLNALKRSPVTGLGLSSGTRYEVFSKLSGYSTDQLPNLHGTLPEVLVGTGIVGVVCFLAALATALARSWQAAWRERHVVSIMLLAALTLNALTHSTFELGSLAALAFLFAGAAAYDAEGALPPAARRLRISSFPSISTVPARIGSPDD